MDAERFDAWTRRRVGLAVASAFGALIGLAAAPEAGAAKKMRCRKVGRGCKSKKQCCAKLKCVEYQDSGRRLCCRKAGGACTRREDCCGFLSCDTDGVCRAIVSDRALKANVGSVDPADMLARVRDLPIATWNYTSDDPAIRHIGPMAQDFAALFNVGDDDRHIHPLDGQGVALAAIQGLAEELARLRAENAGLAERLAALEAERPGSSLP
jgi:hypothetical protein